MMKKNYLILPLLLLCVGSTACGRTAVNLNDYVTVDFNGYNTIGTASSHFDMDKMIAENPKSFGIKGSAGEIEVASVEMLLEDSIRGKLNQTSDLSNGDNITYHWEISNEDSLKEKFPVKFSYEDVSYSVSGLQEAEVFDPFEGVHVNFTGFSPNGELQIETNGAKMGELYYIADKNSGLKNGDTVIIKVDDPSGSGSLNDYCARNGKIPSVTEKEYTVEGLPSYVTRLDEIPEDMSQKLMAQANDTIQAYTAQWSTDANTGDTKSIKETDFIGYYLLTGKEGMSVHPQNQLFFVFRMKSDMYALKRGGSDTEKVHGEETYYTFYQYSDIILLEDGTCSVDMSAGSMCETSVQTDYGYMSFFPVFYDFKGYRDLDSLFNDCITTKIDTYQYESTVQE